MQKHKAKLLSVLLTVIALIGISTNLVLTASAASWKTGEFDTGYNARGYTTVKLSNAKKKAGYIKVYTYSMDGRKTNAKIHITLRDNKGRWICEFNTTSGTKLKLGNDHTSYRVYIAKQWIKSSADRFLNDGKCAFWAINTVSNCYI